MMLATAAGVTPARGQQAAAHASPKATIVLVHGAFADATGWDKVIPPLQQNGYKVVAVQNALASLAGDVETTKRLIGVQTGPIVVVGHSYGGAVITGAAAANPNVKALVYVAAFAPEPGEPVAAFLEQVSIGSRNSGGEGRGRLPHHRRREVPQRLRGRPAEPRDGCLGGDAEADQWRDLRTVGAGRGHCRESSALDPKPSCARRMVMLSVHEWRLSATRFTFAH